MFYAPCAAVTVIAVDGGPDAKQAHHGVWCACLAPGDRLPVGDTTAGEPNTVGRGDGLLEIN
jgi:hypothetical protein